MLTINFNLIKKRIVQNLILNSFYVIHKTISPQEKKS